MQRDRREPMIPPSESRVQPANDGTLPIAAGVSSGHQRIVGGAPPIRPMQSTLSGHTAVAPIAPPPPGMPMAAPRGFAPPNAPPNAPPHPAVPQAPAPPPALADAPEASPPAKKRGVFGSLLDAARKRAKLVLVAAVALVAYGGYVFWDRYQPYEWSGSVEIHTVAVGSRVGGRVADIKVHEGREVEAGDVLVVLDAGELEAKREIAKSELEIAEASLDKLVKGARPEEIAQARARLAEARSAVARSGSMSTQSMREAQAAAQLLKRGAISAAEYQAKLAAAQSAGGETGEAFASVKQAEAALRLMTGEARTEDVRVARATVSSARAKLALVDGQIAEMSIRAPRRGRVERILVRPGDLLRADAPAVTLLEAGQLYVKLYVPETRIGKIRVGQEVPITVDSFPNRQFKGRVDYINEQGEYTPRRLVTTEDRAAEMFATRITLLEGETELRSGMAAFVRIPK